jgi:phosphoglycerate kinase
VSFLTGITSLGDLPLEGRRVIVRADLDVPIAGDEIIDDARIRAALPTIKSALERGAKVIVAAQRALDKRGQALSLEPAGACLSGLSGHEVHLPEDCIGDAPKKVVQDLRPGQICLLENLLFHGEEDSDDPAFAEKLAELGDVYVNDALLASSENHASVHALARIMRERAAGLLLEGELRALDRLSLQPERPYVAVIGGSSFADSAALMNVLLGQVDVLCVGGAVANTVLAARGVDLRSSRVELDKLAQARALLERAASRRVEIVLPEDVIVASSPGAESGAPVAVDEIPVDMAALDVGLKTTARWAAAIASAKTVLWHGLVGVAEKPAFGGGTARLLSALSQVPGFVAVLGDRSAAAALRAALTSPSGTLHVSSAGRASLDLLSGKKLPGVEALRGSTPPSAKP